MALTGTFLADFSSFTAACAGAEVSLRGFETSSAKAGDQVQRITNSLDGTKIIQQAIATSAAIDRIGGVSKLTEAELSRVSFTAQEAAAKMTAMGVEVPPGIQKIADATKGVSTAFVATTPNVNSLHNSMQQFDGVLATMGIHMGPEIKALGELGDASGKTASQIGLVGVAGLAIGAAIGGWKIGRAIADFLGLDEAVSNATAKLLGFGDVAAQTAGAKMDVINKAIAGGAAATISYTDAIKFNNDAQDKFSESLNTSAHRVAVWQGEIAAVTASGALPQIQRDLASQDSTLQQLSTHYNISVEALQFLQRANTTAAAAAKDHETALKAEQKAIDDATEAMAKLTKAQQDHIAGIGDHLFGADDIKAATDMAAALGRVENVSMLTAAAQEQVATTMEAGRNAMIAQGLSADALTGLFEQFRLEATATGRDAAAAIAAINAEAERGKADAAALAAAYVDNFVVIGHKAAETAAAIELSFSNAVAAATRGEGTLVGTIANAPLTSDARSKTQTAWDLGKYYGPVVGGTRENPRGSGPDFTALGYEIGGPTVEGLSMLHGGEYVVPKGGALVTGGGGGTTVINLVVDGKVLASIVNDQNTRTMKQGRKWPSA